MPFQNTFRNGNSGSTWRQWRTKLYKGQLFKEGNLDTMKKFGEVHFFSQKKYVTIPYTSGGRRAKIKEQAVPTLRTKSNS